MTRPGILRAAGQAGADRDIAALPAGYETLLGPAFIDGTDLSTGQWQRMALARTFFRDAPLVILDEPTAALDAKAEHELFGKIGELFADRSVLLISHRFSTVRAADRIYVLREGQVVESGTHEVADGRGRDVRGAVHVAGDTVPVRMRRHDGRPGRECERRLARTITAEPAPVHRVRSSLHQLVRLVLSDLDELVLQVATLSGDQGRAALPHEICGECFVSLAAGLEVGAPEHPRGPLDDCSGHSRSA